jgi:hypothetical protein
MDSEDPRTTERLAALIEAASVASPPGVHGA